MIIGLVPSIIDTSSVLEAVDFESASASASASASDFFFLNSLPLPLPNCFSKRIRFRFRFQNFFFCFSFLFHDIEKLRCWTQKSQEAQKPKQPITD